MTGYREIVVKAVKRGAAGILFVDFENSRISFQMRKSFLDKKGIGIPSPGDYLLVKGKKGNADADLWGFGALEDIKRADEEILMVRDRPLTLILKLPDGCTPGRWESAEALAEIVAKMRKRYPGKTFQLLSFSYNTPSDGTNPALDAVLAIAN